MTSWYRSPLSSPTFAAEIIEPRYLVPWAHTPSQPTPAAALGLVYVVCLDLPLLQPDEMAG